MTIAWGQIRYLRTKLRDVLNSSDHNIFRVKYFIFLFTFHVMNVHVKHVTIVIMRVCW